MALQQLMWFAAADAWLRCGFHACGSHQHRLKTHTKALPLAVVDTHSCLMTQGACVDRELLILSC
jgi:hypothetical protein